MRNGRFMSFHPLWNRASILGTGCSPSQASCAAGGLFVGHQTQQAQLPLHVFSRSNAHSNYLFYEDF
jgi:hypothetical protein